MKKKKIQEINGRDNQELAKKKINSLDELWGIQKKRYKFDSKEKYEEYLKQLNKVDLQNECVKMGVLPRDERNMMINILLKEFSRYQASLETPNIKAVKLQVDEKGQRVLNKQKY